MTIPWGRDQIREDVTGDFFARPYRLSGKLTTYNYLKREQVRCDLCASEKPSVRYEGSIAKLQTPQGAAVSLDCLFCKTCADALQSNNQAGQISGIQQALRAWNLAIPPDEALTAAIPAIRAEIAFDWELPFDLEQPDYAFFRRETLRIGSLGENPDDDAHAYFTRGPAVGTDCIISALYAFRSRFGYAVPTVEALDMIQKYGMQSVIDFAAGNGYWSYLLRKRGIHVKALEIAEVASGSNRFWQTPRPDAVSAWTQIDAGSFNELAQSTIPTLLLIWPPGDDDMGARAIRAFRGDTLIYVGERTPGVTGDAVFHEALASQWTLIEGPLRIPTLYGYKDELHVFKRV